MKAFVDKDGCISCGVCDDVCPEVFHFDEDELSEAIDGDIPEDSIEAAKEARDGCPTEVISLED
ncbi:MAG: ferredoxin [Clostridiales bacterium]|nr:ferredoxin [Clostridiales bacterium]